MADREFDNTNRGALFKNDRKEGDRDPDYRGSLNVDGREYRLTGWLKESRAGVAFLSLSIKPKPATDEKPKPQRRTNEIAF